MAIDDVPTAELIARAAADARDLAASTELVRRHQNMAFATAYALLGDRSSAEDAVQEAFLTAFASLGQLRDSGAFAGWLRRIVQTRCARMRDRTAPRAAALDTVAELPDSRPDPEQALGRQEQGEQILRQVFELPEPQRMAVMLFYLGECSLREVAQLLEVEVGTIKKRLHDARERLGARFVERGIAEMEQGLAKQRPSRDARFVERVAAALAAAARGDTGKIAGLIADEPAVADAVGPHPIWGGELKPLHVAAERNHLAVVRQLLDAGADVDGAGVDYNGWSPLMLAAHGGRLGTHAQRTEIVALLLERGAAVDVFAAALLGDAERVGLLLAEEPARARAIGPAGATALHFARTTAIVRALLAAGAELDAVCGWGTTPLERASFRGAAARDVAEVLIARGARVHACALAGLDDLPRLQALLDADPAALHGLHKVGASITGTPLHAAAAAGHVALARLLLDRGADVNARADMGQTPLHLVQKELALAQLLVERGADVLARDAEHGTTPLTWARFFLENLEPDSAALPGIVAYLEACEAAGGAQRA